MTRSIDWFSKIIPGGQRAGYQQFARYIIVGAVSNAILFLWYFLLTHWGVGAKSAMTLLFILGVAQTFAVNRSWTFGHRGSPTQALVRSLLVYACGYGINWWMLYLLVDRLGYPHQAVQAVAVPLVAVFLFLTHRAWVFPN